MLQLTEPYHIKQALMNLPIKEIWGVGRQLSKQLNAMGIHSSLDLYHADPKMIRKRFSVVLERTVRELHGISCIDFDADPEKKKQIVCSRSMGEKTSCPDRLMQNLATHIARATRQLRDQGSVTRVMTIGIKTNPFSKSDEQYTGSITLRLPEHTDNMHAFLHAARRGFERIYRKGYGYKKTGVFFQDICDASAVQQNMFDPMPDKFVNPDLMSVHDAINDRFGKGTLRSATQGFSAEPIMKQNHLSPAFTTKIDDVIRVR